ncbi:MAG: hypothetical protein U0350_06535 [Caldilineaceae bacterium]
MFRLSGLAVMLGGVIGIINIPLLALAYFATADGAEFAPVVAAWVAVAQPLLKPLLSFATVDEVYLTYGKVMLLVFLGMLAGLLALHARQGFRSVLLEKIGFWVTLVSTLLFLCGVIGAYYVVTYVPAALDFSFFAFLLPGLGTMLIGPLFLGIGTIQASIAPRLAGWLLILGGAPGMLVTRQVVGHNSGGLFVLYLAWIVIGYWLWTTDQPMRNRNEGERKL